MIKGFANAYFAYKLIRILSQKWEDTPAFKAGIIDVSGRTIYDKELTSEQKRVYTSFDRIAYNLKRILSKLPGGQNPFVRMASAIALLKEDDISDSLIESIIADLDEDTPVNTSGGGNVAYTETPMKKKPITRKKLAEFINY